MGAGRLHPARAARARRAEDRRPPPRRVVLQPGGELPRRRAALQFMRRRRAVHARRLLVDERLDPYTARRRGAAPARNYERLGSGRSRSPPTTTGRVDGQGRAHPRHADIGPSWPPPEPVLASRRATSTRSHGGAAHRPRPARYFGRSAKTRPCSGDRDLAKSYGAACWRSRWAPRRRAARPQPGAPRPDLERLAQRPASYALRVPRRPGSRPRPRASRHAATLRFDETPRMVASVRARGGGRTGSPRAGTHRVQAARPLEIAPTTASIATSCARERIPRAR